MKISRKMKSLDAKDIAESISKVMNESLIFTGDLFMQIVDSEKEEQEDWKNLLEVDKIFKR